MKKTVYRSTDLENTTAAEYRSIENKALHSAQTLSFTTKDDVSSGFRGTHDAMKALLGVIAFTLQAESNQNATDKGLISKERRELTLDNEIARDKERELSLSGYARSGGFWRKVKRALLTALLIMLAMSDVIFNQAGLERLLMVPQAVSIVLSIMLAGSIAYCAHSLVPKLSRRGFYIALGIAAIVFLFLGYLRISHTFTFSLHDILMVVTFGLISVLLFFAACRIGMRLLATKNTTEMDQAEKAYKELRSIRRGLRKKEKELATMNNGWQKHEGQTLALSEYGKGLQMNYVNKTKALFWEYLRVAKKHDDNVDQSIFSFSEYPFEFNETATTKSSGLSSVLPVIGAVLLLTFTGCTQQSTVTDMAVFTLVDNSVNLKVVPDTANLIRFTGLRNEQWAVSLTVGFGTIGDVDHMPTYIHRLAPQDRLFGNMVERQAEVQKFTDGMQESLNKTIPPSGSELERTIVYRTVARSAIEVSKLPHKHRVLLVYSDLMNNDGTVTFYGTPGKKVLQKPDKLEQIFLSQVPLPDLNGLEIYFIHQPLDFSNNDSYNAASTFFADMFARHGARTHITATTP